VTAATTAAPLRVVASFGAVLQDQGRIGHEHGGVNRSGASDIFSSRFANLVVGNDAGAAVVEITGAAFAVVTAAPIIIAVTGARAEVLIDGDVRVPQWEAVSLPAGARLDIAAPRTGYRTYLATAGGFAADRLLGSVSPLPPAAFLNAVELEQELSVAGPPKGAPAPRGATALARTFLDRLDRGDPVGVLETTQTAMFEGMERLYSEEFTMSGRSNAVGARFEGYTPVRSDPRELVSRSVPIGSIEIPSAGELIALLRGRLVTAGYPVPAVIAKADIDLVAQLTPGTTTRFARIDETEARWRLLQQELALRELSLAVHGA
jgi:biotin-dependent carboxylase-like uncharacterized protein